MSGIALILIAIVVWGSLSDYQGNASHSGNCHHELEHVSVIFRTFELNFSRSSLVEFPYVLSVVWQAS